MPWNGIECVVVGRPSTRPTPKESCYARMPHIKHTDMPQRSEYLSKSTQTKACRIRLFMCGRQTAPAAASSPTNSPCCLACTHKPVANMLVAYYHSTRLTKCRRPHSDCSTSVWVNLAMLCRWRPTSAAAYGRIESKTTQLPPYWHSKWNAYTRNKHKTQTDRVVEEDGSAAPSRTYREKERERDTRRECICLPSASSAECLLAASHTRRMQTYHVCIYKQRPRTRSHTLATVADAYRIQAPEPQQHHTRIHSSSPPPPPLSSPRWCAPYESRVCVRAWSTQAARYIHDTHSLAYTHKHAATDGAHRDQKHHANNSGAPEHTAQHIAQPATHIAFANREPPLVYDNPSTDWVVFCLSIYNNLYSRFAGWFPCTISLHSVHLVDQSDNKQFSFIHSRSEETDTWFLESVELHSETTQTT